MFIVRWINYLFIILFMIYYYYIINRLGIISHYTGFHKYLFDLALILKYGCLRSSISVMEKVREFMEDLISSIQLFQDQFNAACIMFYFQRVRINRIQEMELLLYYYEETF